LHYVAIRCKNANSLRFLLAADCWLLPVDCCLKLRKHRYIHCAPSCGQFPPAPSAQTPTLLLGKHRYIHCTTSCGQFATSLSGQTPALPLVVPVFTQTDLWQIDPQSVVQAINRYFLNKIWDDYQQRCYQAGDYYGEGFLPEACALQRYALCTACSQFFPHAVSSKKPQPTRCCSLRYRTYVCTTIQRTHVRRKRRFFCVIVTL